MKMVMAIIKPFKLDDVREALAEAGLQHRLEVLLQFFAALAQSRRDQAAEAAGENVELGEVDHAGIVHGEGFLRCRSQHPRSR